MCCWRLFRTEKGLKIHCSKKGCSNVLKNRAAPGKRTGETSNSIRPEDNHSPESQLRSPHWSPPKQRIKFPSSKEEKWQELDKALGQGLRKMMKKESSITSIIEFIYQTSLGKFGPRSSAQASRNHQEGRENVQLSGRKRKYFDVAGSWLWKLVGVVEQRKCCEEII